MRNTLWLLALALAGCHKNPEPDLSVKADQLAGTWNSGSVSTETDKPFMRWTFSPTYAFMKADTQKVCQPLNTAGPYQYWVDRNVLVMRYVGITNGLFPNVDLRRPIRSITTTEIVLDNPRQVLEKCP